MDVVGEAEDGATAIRLTRELQPEVIIMDVNMPGMDGIDATRRISQELPGTKIIALSMHPKKVFVMEMLKAGASGYVLKENAFAELVKAVNTVLAGEVFLCPKVASIVVDDYIRSGQGKDRSLDTVLTDREHEVLKLLAEGKPTKEIALLIKVSVKTVDACRRRIMQKLNISSVAQLVKYAIREGLTSLDT
jgi:DNA-binding NarL/FixJ family response regulator